MGNNSGILFIRTGSIIVFFIAVFFFITVEPGYDNKTINIYIALAVILFVMQGVYSFVVRRQKSWFQIDIMFLIMFFLVHFWIWISIQYQFGEFEVLPKHYLKNVNYSVALSLIGMSSFILGFNLKPNINHNCEYKIEAVSQWKKIGNIIFFVGAALTAAYILYFGTQAFGGGYSGSTSGNLITRSIYLLQGILLKLGILIIIIVQADKNRLIPDCKISLLVLAAVMSMLLVLGDRSEFIYTASVVIFAYARYYKKISLSVLIVGLISVAFLMSAVQLARVSKSRSLSQISDVITSGDDKVSIMGGLNSIAASAGVLLGAVTAIPKRHDYFYGDLKKIELLGIIPFGRAFFIGNSSKQKFDTSSDFLTWYILGPNSKTGTGTTVVADLYVDFGPIGVVLGLMLLGYVANIVSTKVDRKSTLVSAVVFCYFAGLLVMLPRYSFLMIIRGLLWPVLVLWGIKFFFISQYSKTQLMNRENTNEFSKYNYTRFKLTNKK